MSHYNLRADYPLVVAVSWLERSRWRYFAGRMFARQAHRVPDKSALAPSEMTLQKSGAASRRALIRISTRKPS
ncbi:hypothetical protein ACFQZQ_13955 [Lysobacter koreensis]|uniref:Uncharacterized protein n=1 Tax=Lysobacter koreensis TaxID=266122 RepID=A0ABW2YRH0_9GAMM